MTAATHRSKTQRASQPLAVAKIRVRGQPTYEHIDATHKCLNNTVLPFLLCAFVLCSARIADCSGDPNLLPFIPGTEQVCVCVCVSPWTSLTFWRSCQGCLAMPQRCAYDSDGRVACFADCACLRRRQNTRSGVWHTRQAIPQDRVAGAHGVAPRWLVL